MGECKSFNLLGGSLGLFRENQWQSYVVVKDGHGNSTISIKLYISCIIFMYLFTLKVIGNPTMTGVI